MWLPGIEQLNSGPLEKQAMLLITEPSLQPLALFFFFCLFFLFFVCLFGWFFLRQVSLVALVPVLELALIDQAGLEFTEIRLPGMIFLKKSWLEITQTKVRHS